MRRFDKGGYNSIDLAINLSFKQLQDRLFVSTAKRIIGQSGIDTLRLEFELTETAIMSNYQQTHDSMTALSEMGVTFSLDDFGTGFSSFAHIQRLPISVLKIDRSFINDVVENPEDAIIVKAIINMAHSLRLEVVAEGVETAEQLDFLQQNKCDQVQGFFYSRPVTLSELISQYSKRDKTDTL
jgi:EAL domain-containing protein (putative c-di-GMP-specific phosphodiesterase class I)